MVTVKPKEWKNGRTPTMRSVSLIQNIWAIASMFEMMLYCDSMTPFGVPVLPLEKMTVAIESGVCFGASSRAGIQRART